jgi:hypothetical protein
VLREAFGSERDEITGLREKMQNKLHCFHPSLTGTGVAKTTRMRWRVILHVGKGDMCTGFGG